MAEYSITAVDRRVVYDGSSGTGPYAFSFPVLVETDIAVFKNATKLSLTTNYTVTIDSSNGTGSVTLGSAATGSDTITITGARAIERTTDFVTAGDLLASSLNTELDSQTIFAQQVSEDADRAIKAPVTDPTSIDMTLPAKADRLGKLMGFDASTGNPEATTGRINTVSVSTSDVAAGGTSTGSATFTDSTGALALSLGIVVGDTGATGAQGVSSGIEYNYSTTTSDADPSAGNFRINGSFGAGTQIFISDQSAETGNPNVSAFILTWDDSTTTADRGTITIRKKSAPQNFATYKISGASTDATSYVKLAVTAVSTSGSLSNSDACIINFVRTGNAGAGSGDLLAANNLSDLAAAATARTNLGLGSAAVLTAGTSANNAVQLTGSAALPAVSGASLTGVGLTGVHQIWVPAVAISPTATGGAEAYSSTNSSGPDLTGLKFDGSSEESADFSIAAFNSLKTSAAMTFTPYWIGDASTNGCVWGFKAVSVADGEDIDAASFGSEVTSSDVAQSSATELLKGPTSGACTVAGLGAAGELIYVRVSRKVANGSDTISGDTTLIGILIALETDAGNDA